MRCGVYYMILGTEEFNTGVSKVYFRPTKRRPVNYIYVNTCDLDVKGLNSLSVCLSHMNVRAYTHTHKHTHDDC